MHNGLNADALVGGVPPTLVTRDDSAKGGHLILIVTGQSTACGTNGIADVQQFIGTAELIGSKPNSCLIAGILESGQGIIMGQVQTGCGERRYVSRESKAILLTSTYYRLGCCLIVGFIRVDASDDQGNFQSLAFLVIKWELRGVLVVNRAHGCDGQIGCSVIGVTQQVFGDVHVFANIGFALDAVLEEQVGDAIGGLFQLHALRERLGQEVHPPDHGVFAVHGHRILHGHIGVDLHG